MNVIEVSHLAKRFGETQAVADVSFEVRKGEIFGLLGPNGAGKTTTIRLILNIFQADGGRVSILGGPMDESKKDRIGYMPEERGLYQEMALDRCLVYLATLKGVPAAEARSRAEAYLERFDLAIHRKKKVKELSRGMQQKAQIINTVLHRPELLIVDEPFSGLDPVNTRLVKDLMEELRHDGTTIVMSTHMMHQVEELSDRILLINRGASVLYGGLRDIQRAYAGREVLVNVGGQPPALNGVLAATPVNGAFQLTLADGASPQDIVSQLVHLQTPIEQFQIAMPTLDEIFIRAVAGEGTGG